MNKIPKITSGLCGAAMALLHFGARLYAQDFTLDWFTVEGGGATSTGAGYSLNGTIGQPDAAKSSGGGFTVEGGFWSGVSGGQPAVAPRLFIQASGGFATISWTPITPGFVLQVNDSLSPLTWTDAPGGGANPVTLPLAGTARFFRLRPQ